MPFFNLLLFQKMMKQILVALVILSAFSDAQAQRPNDNGLDKGGLSDMKDLRTTPNKDIRDSVMLVEGDVRKLLAARGINSTVNKFEAIKYRSQSLDGCELLRYGM